MTERRLYPRHSLSCALRVIDHLGTPHDATSCDVSIVGLSLYMGRADVVELAQGGSILTPGDAFEVDLPTAPTDPGSDLLRLGCRVRHVRRLSLERYLIGVLFADPSDTELAKLEALLERISERRFV